ncbi:MAG: hypothetical protein ACKUBY_06095 [Candidatus Moraniibacteriota bacterium]|jgi:hypothetical protein
MQKIVIIIAVTTIPLITIIGGLYFFGTMKKQNYVQEAIDSVEDVYYQELARGCSNKDKSEYRCCLASVYDMSDLQAKLSSDNVCKDMAIDQLRCPGSYSWCVPMANVKEVK